MRLGPIKNFRFDSIWTNLGHMDNPKPITVVKGIGCSDWSDLDHVITRAPSDCSTSCSHDSLRTSRLLSNQLLFFSSTQEWESHTKVLNVEL